ncbi:MAG: TIGR03790 family protein [Akkermansiaceae bacterium]|nr:TIGR03790 family protein [Akkermansiaceae bacterium]
MKAILYIFCLAIPIAIPGANAAPIAPESVAVLYNSNIPESKDLAEFYAQMRKIPAANLVGLALPENDQITRQQYNTTLRDPLRKVFSDRGWWTLGNDRQGVRLPTSSKITTLVCMRGVPFKIQREAITPEQAESGPKLPAHFASNNEAAVDSELAMFGVHGLPTLGPLNNPYYNKDSAFADSKIPYMLLVGRIDGPDFTICKRMIGDAIATEARGLWGMCYLDLAKKGGGYEAGDQWLESIAKLNGTTGIPTVVDRNKQTFTTNYPMNDAALYYGWYTTHRDGPLLNKDFKFRRGAVAIHLHSYSASNLRDANKNWTGPLLAKGAAATVGNVYEPYLQLTHHFDVLHDRLVKGYSLVEAAYMAIPALSWQNVVLGDPLYRPFLHLDGSGQKEAADRDYRAIRLANESWGNDPDTMVKKLRTAAAAKANGKFYEYLGLWHRDHQQNQVAIAFFQTAGKKHIKESDRLRQWLYTADILRETGNKPLAIATLKEARQTIDDIPESKTIVALLNILDPPPPPPAKKPAPPADANKKTP